MRRALLLATFALLSGCSGTDALRTQLSTVEGAVERIERKVDALEGRGAPLTVAPAPAPEVGPAARDLLLDLRTALARIEERLARLEERAGRAQAAPRPRRDDVVDRRAGPLPKPGERLQVLSVGAGDLLLVRINGTPQRLRLLGVDAPQRTYPLAPERAREHKAAFRADLSREAAWEASKRALEELVAGKTLQLAADVPAQWEGGALVACVELVGSGKTEDLVGELIRSGHALSARLDRVPEAAAARVRVYLALEREARAAGAGILRPN